MIDPISKEYVTFRFQKGEEILVPRSLVEKSPPLKKLLKNSHDNVLNIDMMVDKIAHDTLDDVFLLLRYEDPIHTDPESLMRLIKALDALELNHLESKTQKILSRVFNHHSSS